MRDGTIATRRRRRLQGGRIVEALLHGLSAFNGELDKVAASRFDPDVLRTFVTGDRFTEVLDGLDDTAPAEIAADVEADTEWLRTRWSDVLAEYDYDIRDIYLDATPEDLAVFNRTHPDVLEHTSRNTAYEEQVCATSRTREGFAYAGGIPGFGARIDIPTMPPSLQGARSPHHRRSTYGAESDSEEAN